MTLIVGYIKEILNNIQLNINNFITCIGDVTINNTNLKVENVQDVKCLKKFLPP